MIPLEPLAGAFVFGIANAAHCAGMCGVFALRAGGLRRFAAYAAGKTFVYTAFGAVAGAVGAEAVRALGAVQGWLGIATAVFLLAAGVRLLVPPRGAGDGAWAALLAPFAGAVERARETGSSFLFGAATGLLPCGVTYLAAAQAGTTASAAGGALAMAAFGLGTVPVLLVTAVAGRGAFLRLGPARVRRAGGVVLILTGLVAGVRAALPLVSGDGAPHCH